MNLSKSELIKKIIDKPEAKIKGITLKMTLKDYETIKNFCKRNKIKMSDLLNIKIKELIELIN